MNDRIQKWLADNSVKALLERILSAVVLDKKEKEESWKKLQEAIPKEIVGSLSHERVPGSPLVWAGGTDPYIMNVETGKHIKDWGMNKKAVQAFVKEIKAKVNELNGKTAKHEEELAKAAAAKKAKQEEKAAKEAAVKAAELEAQRQYQKKVNQSREKIKNRTITQDEELFVQQSDNLSPLDESNTKAKWNSEYNRAQHVNPDGTLKHQKEYPNMTEQDFLKLAKELADKPVDGVEILGYGCRAGDTGAPTVCRYNIKTHDYVKMNSNGLVTMFKFDENWDAAKLKSRGVKTRYEWYVKNQGLIVPDIEYGD